jgi:hypothetical protein
LSIERALASGRLEESVKVSVRLQMHGTQLDLEELMAQGVPSSNLAQWAAAFGRLSGTIAIDGTTKELDAVGRIGLSFTGIGTGRLTSRRMLWACFPAAPARVALEARAISNEDGTSYSAARVLGENGWAHCDVSRFQLEAPSVEAPPETIAAMIAVDGAMQAALSGEVRNFVPLSRPGPNQSRIYTTLGFASFKLGDHHGAGMFEYSRRAAPLSSRISESEGNRD